MSVSRNPEAAICLYLPVQSSTSKKGLEFFRALSALVPYQQCPNPLKDSFSLITGVNTAGLHTDFIPGFNSGRYSNRPYTAPLYHQKDPGGGVGGGGVFFVCSFVCFCSIAKMNANSRKLEENQKKNHRRYFADLGSR